MKGPQGLAVEQVNLVSVVEKTPCPGVFAKSSQFGASPRFPLPFDAQVAMTEAGNAPAGSANPIATYLRKRRKMPRKTCRDDETIIQLFLDNISVWEAEIQVLESR
jgi:hypothetical protein